MARKKFTTYVDEEVIDDARSAAAFLAGHPLYLDLGRLTEGALRAEIERLSREHNGGQPFPRGRPKAGPRPDGRGRS
jgi:hypothetical protein